MCSVRSMDQRCSHGCLIPNVLAERRARSQRYIPALIEILRRLIGEHLVLRADAIGAIEATLAQGDMVATLGILFPVPIPLVDGQLRFFISQQQRQFFMVMVREICQHLSTSGAVHDEVVQELLHQVFGGQQHRILNVWDELPQRTRVLIVHQD